MFEFILVVFYTQKVSSKAKFGVMTRHTQRNKFTF